jgi:hypothetical protein
MIHLAFLRLLLTAQEIVKKALEGDETAMP